MSSSQDPDEKELKLAKLRELKGLYDDCLLCPLSKSRSRIVFAEGPPDARVLMVVDAPGDLEEQYNAPIVGKSRVMLLDLLERIGVKESELHLTGATICKPPDGRTPNNKELAACRPRLMEHIRRLDPDVVVLLGKSALRAVTSRMNASISSERGKLFDQVTPGTALPLTYPTIATYHPSYLLRDPDQTPGGLVYQMTEDLRAAFQVADQLNFRLRGVPLPERKYHG